MTTLKTLYLAVAIVALGVNLILFMLYRKGGEPSAAKPFRRFFSGLEFSPQSLGGFNWTKLILASILLLFLELLVIRWVSSEIRIFAYLKNFVLIACFLGFGLGCYINRRPIHLTAIFLPLFFVAILVKWQTPWMREFIDSIPVSFGRASEVDIWGVPVLPESAATYARLAAATVIIALLFAMISAMFIPLGQLVGWYLENSPRGILAYSLNVLASLAGILLYTLLALWNQPPATWFAVAGVLIALLLMPRGGLAALSLLLFGALAWISALPEGRQTEIYWSPYQKLMLMSDYDAQGVPVRHHLLTNNIWYQQIVNLSPEFVSAHPELHQDVAPAYNAYNMPYRLYPSPGSVLVLGAGAGNDVAAALRGGAERVVAVEIDPTILKLGRELHFEKPYDSPRVDAVVDDARSYIQRSQNSGERFDLIVFSLLDSHTNSSHYSNIRIDNYVYTVEALRAARQLLAPDGIFIIKFQVATPWIAARLYGLMHTVFDSRIVHLESPATRQSSGGRFFVAGPNAPIDAALADPSFREHVKILGEEAYETTRLTTDDWPYFYQHAAGLPTSVILIFLVLGALGWFEIRAIGPGVSSIRFHFFFLGAGFMMLETQIISKLALLFGTTWIVNSIVIAVILLLIVMANGVYARFPRFDSRLAYAGIFASLALIYFLPIHIFFFESAALKALASGFVFCLPVFFASIVFIQNFARAGYSGSALGSNLFGAMIGGLLESFSLWTGMQSLLIAVAFLYFGSMLFLRRERLAPVPFSPSGTGT